MPGTTKPKQRRRTTMSGFTIRDFPAPLKRRIAQRAKRDGTNLNDVAVGALAEHFGVAFTPSGKASELGNSTYVYLEMPRALRRRINSIAAQREVSGRRLILAVLDEAFPA